MYFLVKLKFKDSLEACYAVYNTIESVKGLREESSPSSLKNFFVSLESAKKIMLFFILKSKSDDSWPLDKPLEYISVVECSNYYPHREYQVVQYFDKF